MGTLHEDLGIFMISCSVIRTVRNVADKFVEKIETHIWYLMIFNDFFFTNGAAYEIKLKNIVGPDRSHVFNYVDFSQHNNE